MKLAVILPVYNAEAYLAECLQSLLAQSLTDFCILAINDASTDRSGEILEAFAQQDPRLRVYHLEKNSGDPIATQLAFNLLNYMQVKYVARMDADDICLAYRFEAQVRYLDEHPDIDVVGANMLTIDQSGIGLDKTDAPLTDSDIKANLVLARVNIFNPTAMWRHATIKPLNWRYNTTETACDYGMWVHLAICGKRFANLPEPLVKYRLHDNQESHKLEKVKKSVQQSLSRYFRALYPTLTAQEIQLLTSIFNGSSVMLTIPQYLDLLNLLTKAIQFSTPVLGENRTKIIEYMKERRGVIRQSLERAGVKL